LIQKAAKQGHTLAQAELAKLYFYGQGIGKDYVSAVTWAVLAAEQGDKGSIQLREDFLTLYKSQVTKADIVKGEEIAETLRKEIADTVSKLR
jgi:TPR repeat protein